MYIWLISYSLRIFSVRNYCKKNSFCWSWHLHNISCCTKIRFWIKSIASHSVDSHWQKELILKRKNRAGAAPQRTAGSVSRMLGDSSSHQISNWQSARWRGARWMGRLPAPSGSASPPPRSARIVWPGKTPCWRCYLARKWPCSANQRFKKIFFLTSNEVG